jgi:hypothetical protein
MLTSVRPSRTAGAVGPQTPPTPAVHSARQAHRMADLAVWKRKIRGVDFAVRSSETSRQNPIVTDSLVIASLWSPGAIYAADRANGLPVWRRPLLPLAHESVYLADGMLYAHTDRGLHALDPDTGQALWTWNPFEGDREDLIASPTVDAGRLFIGDLLGRFWCLDAASGQTLWLTGPSAEEAPSIKATALVQGRAVTIADAAGTAFSYEARTGREIWHQKLDGPASGELFRFKGHVAIRTFWSVYLLDARDGHVVERWHWRGRRIRHLAGARDCMLVVTQRAYCDMATKPQDVLFASQDREPDRLLIGLSADGELFRQPAPLSLTGLRWSAETGLAYESRLDGLGILDPRTGDRLHSLVAPWDRHSAHCGQVEVRDGLIYLLGAHGELFALRHPEPLRPPRRG